MSGTSESFLVLFILYTDFYILLCCVLPLFTRIMKFFSLSVLLKLVGASTLHVSNRDAHVYLGVIIL